MNNGVQTQEYTSKLYNLQFSYPKKWLLMENQEIGGIQLFASHADDEPNYLDNISILVRPHQANISGKVSTINFIANELVKSNYQTLKNFVLLSLNHHKINDLSVKELTFCYNNTDPASTFMFSMQVVFVQNGKLVLFSFMARENKFSEYLPQVRDLMESLEMVA